YLWLQAYERHYREQVFQALSANHARGHWPQRHTRPQAQLIFCMDDREEGFRRHLESINPQLETLGVAAFFNLPMNWRGLDDAMPIKLCPVPVHPVHLVQEQVRAGSEACKTRHDRHRGLRLQLQQGLHQLSRSSPVAGTLAGLLAAPFSLALLLGKSFAPRTSGYLSTRLQQDWDTVVPTEVNATAAHSHPERSVLLNQEGFTDTEQVELVADFLQTHGLATDFAPLVVLVGHYSTNQNNPHQAAYGCGACSGRYSGPNARTFASIANRPVIRTRLAERGIVIPEDCWFIGAEHDTCSEAIRWQDADQVPATHQSAFTALQQDLQQAARHSAHERCRKLASAPRNPGLDQALRHMQARSQDFSQPRPELGHATNALAIIGRRHLSQGLFLDRRAFLISYDWRTDPDGSILERIILSAGPVGAGISLEYYFSSVDNEHYGCGSKVAHNITGLFGVMQGGSSDLRTGLPRQMIEIHEPMRLLMVLEAPPERVGAIYARQPLIRELVGNGWVLLGVKEPEQGQLYGFHPRRGLEPWQADAELAPTARAASSAAWYQGSDRHLPPALLEPAAPAPHPVTKQAGSDGELTP
nr:Na-translocating system protein MpsB [Thiolinea sp.]